MDHSSKELTPNCAEFEVEAIKNNSLFLGLGEKANIWINKEKPIVYSLEGKPMTLSEDFLIELEIIKTELTKIINNKQILVDIYLKPDALPMILETHLGNKLADSQIKRIEYILTYHIDIELIREFVRLDSGNGFSKKLTSFLRTNEELMSNFIELIIASEKFSSCPQDKKEQFKEIYHLERENFFKKLYNLGFKIEEINQIERELFYPKEIGKSSFFIDLKKVLKENTINLFFARKVDQGIKMSNIKWDNDFLYKPFHLIYSYAEGVLKSQYAFDLAKKSLAVYREFYPSSMITQFPKVAIKESSFVTLKNSKMGYGIFENGQEGIYINTRNRILIPPDINWSTSNYELENGEKIERGIGDMLDFIHELSHVDYRNRQLAKIKDDSERDRYINKAFSNNYLENVDGLLEEGWAIFTQFQILNMLTQEDHKLLTPEQKEQARKYSQSLKENLKGMHETYRRGFEFFEQMYEKLLSDGRSQKSAIEAIENFINNINPLLIIDLSTNDPRWKKSIETGSYDWLMIKNT